MKTKQSASLGKLTDFTVPPTPDERITALEKRVATLEALLAETMIALDGVNSQPREKVKPSPRGSKPPARAQAKKNASQSNPTPGVAIPEGVTTEILSAVEKAVTETQGQQRSAIADALSMDPKLCGRALSFLCTQKKLLMQTEVDGEKKRTLFFVSGGVRK